MALGHGGGVGGCVGLHLRIRSAAGPRHIAMETIGKVLIGGSHVFILMRGDPVILPPRAFGESVDRRREAAAA